MDNPAFFKTVRDCPVKRFSCQMRSVKQQFLKAACKRRTENCLKPDFRHIQVVR